MNQPQPPYADDYDPAQLGDSSKAMLGILLMMGLFAVVVMGAVIVVVYVTHSARVAAKREAAAKAVFANDLSVDGGPVPIDATQAGIERRRRLYQPIADITEAKRLAAEGDVMEIGRVLNWIVNEGPKHADQRYESERLISIVLSRRSELSSRDASVADSIIQRWRVQIATRHEQSQQARLQPRPVAESRPVKPTRKPVEVAKSESPARPTSKRIQPQATHQHFSKPLRGRPVTDSVEATRLAKEGDAQDVLRVLMWMDTYEGDLNSARHEVLLSAIESRQDELEPSDAAAASAILQHWRGQMAAKPVPTSVAGRNQASASPPQTVTPKPPTQRSASSQIAESLAEQVNKLRRAREKAAAEEEAKKTDLERSLDPQLDDSTRELLRRHRELTRQPKTSQQIIDEMNQRTRIREEQYQKDRRQREQEYKKRRDDVQREHDAILERLRTGK